METVLGLSVSGTKVQTVLVEGRDAAGVTLESGTRASEQVAEAVLSMAATNGYRLRSIGVTWSQDGDLAAARVLDSLSDLGFDNVVAVQLAHAADALARSIGRVMGFGRTAVLVVEPDSATLALVDTVGGEVETLASHALDGEALHSWIAGVFERDDWRPEGMFVVGGAGGLDRLAAGLGQRLGLPVFDPPEAELALAHGAALASADEPVLELGPALGYPAFTPAPDPRRALRGPLTLLAGGAITFVVACALAISPHLLPAREVAPASQPQVQEAPARPAPASPAPQAPPAPVIEEAPPLPAPPPVVEEPVQAAPVETAEAPPAPVVEAPAPVIEAPAPVVEAPAPVMEAPAPIAPPPPAVAPMAPPVPQVQQPRLRDRILDKIPGLDRFGIN